MNARLTILMSCLLLSISGSAQYLSNLWANKAAALYTSYAAPPERSNYRSDQGYSLAWFDDESGIEFISKDGPNLGIALQFEDQLRFRLQEIYSEPVVTISYSDLVKYHYYPQIGLRVEVRFAVYSSETAFLQCIMKNEGAFPVRFGVLPYLYYPSGDSINDFEHSNVTDGYVFTLRKKRDPWMVEHKIPVAEALTGSVTLTGCNTLSGFSFVRSAMQTQKADGNEVLAELISSIMLQKRGNKYVKGLILHADYHMYPGDETTFIIQLDLAESAEKNLPVTFNRRTSIDFPKLVKDDEQAYSKIPKIKFRDKDQEMLYWSCFSLMRQCMMPPEGECRHNYYVFSREPRWGWGYGGQVFHESLAMLAYVFMDPVGAMNSQRVFMDRQRPDGYINYRTGPYLNETIMTNGQPTSSAPWFNYENYELYKVTGDREFLKEAYASGKKFYQYYTAARDSNSNGLCEWGGHAELESVRDARVAVWDKVGWASNFEGPDVNSMLVMEAKSLAGMAEKLGLTQDAEMWQADAKHRSALINKYLWDPETHFYYNVNRSDQSFTFRSVNDLKIKEIIGFLPLWAGIAKGEQVKFLVEKMMDTTEFWRRYGIPSLTAASNYYCPIGYWNGPVWVQWQYLLYRGLRNLGYHDEAAELSNRVLNNMIFHLKNDHQFWEFYSPDDRQAGWNKTYIWAGLAARFLIDSMQEP